MRPVSPKRLVRLARPGAFQRIAGLAMSRGRDVLFPASDRAESQLHPPRIARRHGTADCCSSHGDQFAAGGTDQAGHIPRVTTLMERGSRRGANFCLDVDAIAAPDASDPPRTVDHHGVRNRSHAVAITCRAVVSQ